MFTRLHCPLISALATPYTSTPLLLSMLTTLQDHQDMPPMLPPYVLPHPSLGFRNPAPYNPHAPTAPSRYASNAPLNPPYTHIVPSRHASNTTYHPYTCIVPSRYASNAAYHPYACVMPSQHASDTAFTPA
ncbi:hypothetical protein O181_023473 [Austropuccinia psidii MF-1]|uniref:Uncharacterized protein n=1 Tax=Austropuccinia psidii MF-1 TaxID=1389203 RepID=A0A9Q3GXB5_9BASI|nr:hypothetical protein [Austropuccinia psidii MF-1]